METSDLLRDIILGGAEAGLPPRRMQIADAAAQYMYVHRPGGNSGPWDPSTTPYMIEPMNRLTDRSVEGVIFVGPARTGKTLGLILGWLTYAVTCDPGDFFILHMSEATARDFSKSDLARAHRHSPELAARVSPYATDNNIFDRSYKHGMRLMVGWPSVTQLSGRTLRYVALTDYDRMPADIDGEGDAFTLARKRTQTFHSAGRVMVESSPGWPIDNPKWVYGDPHEGPPCQGIFSLFNQGDRNRSYWPCPHCAEYFTPSPYPDAFVLIDDKPALICPKCGSAIDAKHKRAMNHESKWLAAGQTITAMSVISGTAPVAKLASYWLTGPAAAYQSWDSLWQRHATATAEMERTGSEESLKAVLGGDFGMAYRPRLLHAARDPRALQSRAEDVQQRTVPEGVWYLTAAVDVQKSRFVVQVIGWGEAGERWLIDRFSIRHSHRYDGAGQAEPIDPAARVEDWWLLVNLVMHKVYPLAWDERRGLRPVMTAGDSGGKAGVTERAYLFWRRLRGQGLHQRYMLVKGGSQKDAPRIKKSYPDATKRVQQNRANARGEIPVWMLNTLILKDAVAADLERAEPGPGYIHFPAWLAAWFFDELTAETRTAKGWENMGGARNEAFDLMVYNSAAMLALGGDKLTIERRPGWANPETAAIPIETPPPAVKPPPGKPEQRPAATANGGSFINRPSGVPWMRR